MSIALPRRDDRPAVTSTLPLAAQILHWLTAVLVIGLFGSGVMMTQLGGGPLADLLYLTHKTAGAGLFCLVLVRLCYRLVAQVTARWQPGVASHPVHAILYLGLLVVPLIGWAGTSGYGARELLFGLELPAFWPWAADHAQLLLASHAWLAFGLIALVVVHIGLAIGGYLASGTTERR